MKHIFSNVSDNSVVVEMFCSVLGNESVNDHIVYKGYASFAAPDNRHVIESSRHQSTVPAAPFTTYAHNAIY